MPRLHPSRPRAQRLRTASASRTLSSPSRPPTSIGGRLQACALIARTLAATARSVQARPRRRRTEIANCLYLLETGFLVIATHLAAVRRGLPAACLLTDSRAHGSAALPTNATAHRRR